MPDSQGNYLGDLANILPTNERALLHFSDQFAATELRKQQQRAARAEAEQQRVDKLTGFIGNNTMPKDYASGTSLDPLVNDNLAVIQKEAFDMVKSGASNNDVMQHLLKRTGELKAGSDTAKRIKENIVKSTAEAMKEDPDLDANAFAELQGTYAYRKRDKDGNWIAKDLSELNDQENYSQTVFDNNPDLLYHDPSAGLRRTLGAEKLEEVGRQSIVDPNTGEITSVGYKGKVPTAIMEEKEDETGRVTYAIKAEPYKLPDGNTYIDPNTRKPVTVVSPAVYDRYKGVRSIITPIEAQVRKDLEKVRIQTAPALPGQPAQESTMGPDSDYADMLRRKYLFEKLDEQTKGSFQPIMDDASQKAFDNQRRIKAEQRAAEALQLSRRSNQLQQDKFAWDKLKENKKDVSIDDIIPLTVSVGETAGKDYIMLNSKGEKVVKRFVRTLDVDQLDLQMVTGNTVNAEGKERNFVKPAEITLPGDKGKTAGYYVLPNGDWEGATGQIIKKERVADAQLKYFTKDDLPASSKGIRGTVKEKFKKVVEAFKPTKPSSKIKGFSEGELN